VSTPGSRATPCIAMLMAMQLALAWDPAFVESIALEHLAPKGWSVELEGDNVVYRRGTVRVRLRELGRHGERFRVVRVTSIERPALNELRLAVDAFLAEGFGPIEMVPSLIDPKTTLLIQTLEAADPLPLFNDNGVDPACGQDGVLAHAEVLPAGP
jgi:hypothetical protein